MALQSIKGGLWIPSPSEVAGTGGIAFATAATLTANTHRCAFICQVPKTGSIHKVGFRYGTCSTAASTRIQAKIETVGSTTGDPSGSAYGGMVAGTSSIQPVSNTYDTITLGTDATATAGDVIAACLDYQTFTAADSVVIQTISGGEVSNFPYSDAFTASWSKSSNPVLIGLEYSDGSYEFLGGSMDYTTVTGQAYNSGSSPNEYALNFTLPFPGRLKGIGACVTAAAATQSYEIDWYPNNTTTPTTVLTMSHRAMGSTSARLTPSLMFTTAQTFAANQINRVSVRPLSGTNVTLEFFTYNSVAIMDQDEGGQSFFLCTLSGGAWTDTTTQRPSVYLLIDEFDDAVSAGGVKVHPGMDGGCRA
jgi:hypothetical protein